MTAATDTVTLADLYADVREHERSLAPGSETIMLGDFWEATRKVCEIPSDPGDYDSVTVPREHADWWRAAYATAEADPTRDAQDIYDSLQ